MNQLLKLHIDNLSQPQATLNVAKTDVGATIYIYDVIDADFGVSAISVIDAINQLGDVPTLSIRINSPGGSVFEARAIMAAIQGFTGKTAAYIDSLCASAATSIALACDEVVMSDGALFMIHNPAIMTYGDKQTLRDTADLLQKVELSIIKDYTTKTGKPDAEIIAMMGAETWLTAAEALAHGFVDSIAATKSKPSNSWNLSAYANAPPIPITEPTPTPEPADNVGFFMSDANANRLRLIQI